MSYLAETMRDMRAILAANPHTPMSIIGEGRELAVVPTDWLDPDYPHAKGAL
jgi:hypothetical protein